MAEKGSYIIWAVIYIGLALNVGTCDGRDNMNVDPAKDHEHHHQRVNGILKIKKGSCIYRLDGSTDIIHGNATLASTWKENPLTYDSAEFEDDKKCDKLTYEPNDRTINELTEKALSELFEKFPNSSFQRHRKGKRCVKSIWNEQMVFYSITLQIQITNNFKGNSWKGKFHVVAFEDQHYRKPALVKLLRFSVCRREKKQH